MRLEKVMDVVMLPSFCTAAVILPSLFTNRYVIMAASEVPEIDPEMVFSSPVVAIPESAEDPPAIPVRYPKDTISPVTDTEPSADAAREMIPAIVPCTVAVDDNVPDARILPDSTPEVDDVPEMVPDASCWDADERLALVDVDPAEDPVITTEPVTVPVVVAVDDADPVTAIITTNNAGIIGICPISIVAPSNSLLVGIILQLLLLHPILIG